MSKSLPCILTTLFLLTFSLVLSAQNQKITVSGTVADSVTGLTLPNVNISIVGTPAGGTTNQSGEFSLVLNRIPAVLYFSHVGYAIGSHQVEKTREKNIRILLQPENKEIDEVIIPAARVSKVLRGDTMNLIDFEIADDRIFLLASTHKQTHNTWLYLTTLSGDTLDCLPVRGAGKVIKIPEGLMPQTDYLIRDFTAQILYLDKQCAHELMASQNKITWGFDVSYQDFTNTVLPMQCEMMGRLVFQISGQQINHTMVWGRDFPEAKLLKRVVDPKGNDRYVGSDPGSLESRTVDMTKRVAAPMFRKGNELYIFDFFGGNFEVFDADLNSIRTVPINFQNTTITDWLVLESQGLNTLDFTQQVFFDEKAGKAYAYFKLFGKTRQQLKEVNLETGSISRVIEFPDFTNISHIRVYDNVVYFLYDAKTYPYYRFLYRMPI